MPRPIGSGRKAGTPNKRTIARNSKLAKSGLSPLDFMLKTMRNAKLPRTERLQAAQAAAPYVHPRLSAQLTQQINDAFRREHPLDPVQDANIIEDARAVAFAMAQGAEEVKRKQNAETAAMPRPALPRPPVYREVDRRGQPVAKKVEPIEGEARVIDAEDYAGSAAEQGRQVRHETRAE